ncbi:MAG: hypothetical protein C0609_06870 [Deltaproteobacteria bacterium]|nr:MAG: hypothetical protein C0609_06870 [Deltaproteobacteria bacterium]
MRKLKKLSVIAIAVLMIFTTAAAFAKSVEEASEGMIAVGADPIPFSLIDLDGNTIVLNDMLGDKAVLLVFWSLFCGPCQKELPLVDTITKTYKDKGLNVYAVNLDGPRRGRAVRKYMSKNEFTFSVLWEQIEDAAYVTADAYGVNGTPSIVLIGKNKKIAYVHVGQANEVDLDKAVQQALSD